MSTSNPVSERSGEHRILLVSLRDVLPQISRSLLYEGESVLEDVKSVACYAPQRLLPQTKGLRRRLTWLRRSMQRREQARQLRAWAAGQQPFDLVVVNCQGLADLERLGVAAELTQLGHRSVCLFAEVWRKNLHWHARAIRELRLFDAVHIACAGSVAELADRAGTSVSYLPPAVDCLRFVPKPGPRQPEMDFYWMGRRQRDTHATLLALQEAGDITYRFDPPGGPEPNDWRTHRDVSAGLIHGCRYFMVNPAKSEMIQQTGGQEEVGYRFFEGAAAGAVMVGKAPDNEAFRLNFDWDDAVIHLDYGATDVGFLLDELRDRPERLQQLGTRNATQSLRRHDWAYRWQNVLQGQGLGLPPRLVQRCSELSKLAEALEQAG